MQTFQHLGLALFQAAYVNSHWNIVKNWNFSLTKERCIRAREDDEVHHAEGLDDNHGGDDDDDFEDGEIELAGRATENTQCPLGAGTSLLTKSTLGTFVKSGQRYIHAKKLFDEVAAHFASHDLFSSFVEVIRAVIVTCKSGDPNAVRGSKCWIRPHQKLYNRRSTLAKAKET